MPAGWTLLISGAEDSAAIMASRYWSCSVTWDKLPVIVRSRALITHDHMGNPNRKGPYKTNINTDTKTHPPTHTVVLDA